jgi:hypothetical protein
MLAGTAHFLRLDIWQWYGAPLAGGRISAFLG